MRHAHRYSWSTCVTNEFSLSQDPRTRVQLGVISSHGPGEGMHLRSMERVSRVTSGPILYADAGCLGATDLA
jgi:hypothetical protein